MITGFPVEPGNLEYDMSRSRNSLEFVPKGDKTWTFNEN